MTFRKAKQAPRPEPVLVDDGDGGFPVETSGPEATMLVIVSRGVVEVPHPTEKVFAQGRGRDAHLHTSEASLLSRQRS